MAKFIELPYGKYNPETQKNERTQMLVNTDRIISIAPFESFSCMVTLAGGKQMGVYRKYDTLRAQITNRTDLMETYPDEEVAAAFELGFKKATEEAKKQVNMAALIKAFSSNAISWLETNPLASGWQSKFRKAMKEMAQGQPATENESTEEE